MTLEIDSIKNYSEEVLEQAKAIVDANVVHNDKTIFYVTLGQSGNSKDVRFVLYRLLLNCQSPHVNPFEFVCVLGDDLINACKKAKKSCGTNPVVIDFERQNVIAAYRQWTPNVVRFGKNYGLKLEQCEPKFVMWVAKGCPLYDEKEKCWGNYYFGGMDFMQIARECAVKMGYGVVEDDKFYTLEQYQKMTERRQLLNSIKQDHHYTEGARIMAEMTIVKIAGYESQYGYVKIITMVDQDNRAFTYKGSSFPVSPEIGNIYKIKGTIKHGEYKETKQTFIQRMKIETL